MNPLSIILVFVFLVSLVLLGAFLIRISIVKLREQVRVGVGAEHGMMFLSLHGLLMALGLLLAIYGVVGTYRVVWGG